MPYTLPMFTATPKAPLMNTRYLIELGTTGRYWKAAPAASRPHWATILDGSYKPYRSKALAEKTANRLYARGLDVRVVEEPNHRLPGQSVFSAWLDT